VHAVTLTIGERQFRLLTTTDLAQFSDRLVAAVQSGGGMVEIPVPGAVAVSVLVSAGVHIVLETHELDPESILDSPAMTPWLAVDDIEY
jgi:hypothetical protein